MKENINFDNNVTDLNETELLRKDTKNLIYSLKKHQDAVKESFSKLKDENNQYDYEQDQDEQLNIEISKNVSKAAQKIKVAYFLETEVTGNDETNPNDDYLINDSYHDKKVSSSVKTVSFNEYIQEKENIATNRRSRSVSPNLNKTPTKSILKKQLVQDELSDESSNDLNSSSNSTNSLLCSDIYGDFEKDFDFNDITYQIPVPTVQTVEQPDVNSIEKNTKELIEFITKKRESYLSHSYTENKPSKNEAKNNKEKTVEKKQPTRVQGARESKASAKKAGATTNTWNRSKSADHEKPKPATPKAPANSNHRINKSTNKKGLDTQKQSSVPISTSSSSLKSSDLFKSKMKMKLPSSLKKETRDYKRLASQIKKNKPLLGYDWAVDNIETNLNTTKTKYTKPEEYWQELSKFRSQNKEECISSKKTNFDGSTTSFFEMDSKAEMTIGELNADKNQENDDGRNHKCIHSYTLNDRLFPVPVYKGKNGQSACPVCKSGRKEASNFTPQFCKISIPKARIMEPYKIQFSKEVSEDSVSLAGNCKTGYQNTTKKSSTIYKPTKSKHVDLKSASGIANEISKLSIDEVKRIQQNRDPATAGVYNKGHAMRYELEDQHQKRLREFAT